MKFWGGSFWDLPQWFGLPGLAQQSRCTSRPFSATLAGTSWAPESPPVRPCSRREQVACRRVQPSSLPGVFPSFPYATAACRVSQRLLSADVHVRALGVLSFARSCLHRQGDKPDGFLGGSHYVAHLSPTGHLHQSPSCSLEETCRTRSLPTPANASARPAAASSAPARSTARRRPLASRGAVHRGHKADHDQDQR